MLLAKLSQARSHAPGETQPSVAPCSWRATRTKPDPAARADGQYPTIERITAQRPVGRLPWEAKDTKQLVGVSGANVTDLVGDTGIEPVTSSV
jgi:hypothetical protein